MNPPLHVAHPPSKPIMVFDGDCGFCRRWVARWHAATGDAVEYLPSQDERIALEFPEIPREVFEQAVQLILPDGAVYGGAEAVYRSLAVAGADRTLFWLYRKLPPFAVLSEVLYHEISTHRESLSKLDRTFFGAHSGPPSYVWVRSIFLRGLALIYLIAFLSFWPQVHGLIGSQGIAPAEKLMQSYRTLFAQKHIGSSRYIAVPTLAWWSASDRALTIYCAAGVVLSFLLLLGIAPSPALFLLWLIYLSLANASGPFLSFQWDALLLETGFLAIFLAPRQWRERPTRQPPPSRIVVWLLRWLVFRLMFESGCVKLLSSDPTWWHLRALSYHFETQPLPTPLAWYAHHLPAAFLSFCVLVLFLIEIVLPFFILAGRRWRAVAAGAFVGVQVLILLTGNYCFFNWLSILLCIPLLDDAQLASCVPGWLIRMVRGRGPRMGSTGERMPEAQETAGLSADAPFSSAGPVACATQQLARWRWPLTLPLAGLILLVTAPEPLAFLSVGNAWPGWSLRLRGLVQPTQSFNSYGLFAVMTIRRPEIMLEGSNDGKTWAEYGFKYQPGDTNRPPAFVAPYQPRLDWQMWFAALGDIRQNQWLLSLEYRLLQNSPPVIALFGHNPFPKAPPKYVRALIYDYQFTDAATRAKTGAWWQRRLLGVYTPPLSLENFKE